MTRTQYIDPYVDWAVALAEARGVQDDATTFVPVFFEGGRQDINTKLAAEKIEVSVGRSDTEDLPSNVTRLLEEPNSIGSDFSNSEISSFYYVPLGKLRAIAENDDARELVKGVGIPVVLNGQENEALKIHKGIEIAGAVPIVAVIDEGIGYLNERFCFLEGDDDDKQVRTRFLALWQQAIETPTPMKGSSFVKVGRILFEGDINADIAKVRTTTDDVGPLTEFGVYAERNAEIHPSRSHRSTEQAFSHGTAILDLAAGVPIEDGTDGADLLAVQLPPETLEDTSGTHLPTFLMMGLDWLLTTAANLQRPIIINISLGYPAGIKSGESLLERKLNERVAAYNSLPGMPISDGPPLAQIVLAYGNSYRERLTARFDFSPEVRKGTLDWNIPPDDATASFLHIHLAHATSDDVMASIKVTLTSPSGQTFAISPAPHEFQDVTAQDPKLGAHVTGRAFQDTLDGASRLTIALAPTRQSSEGGLWADSGSWKIKAESIIPDPVSVIFQVQRDDTAAGFARGGRQSSLDHPNAYEEDFETKNLDRPDGGAGVTRLGTNSAIMAKPTDGVHLVGAIQADLLSGANAVKATRETAASADWSQRTQGQGPTFSTLSEDGVESPGVIAAGTFSGTTVLVNGTSVAAAKMTRLLSGVGPELVHRDDVTRTNRIGEVWTGAGGARPRHPER